MASQSSRIEMETKRMRDAAIRELIEQHCMGRDEKGWLIRGVVSKIQCRCGAMRWDDGTPCRNVVGGTSLHPVVCGRYPEKVRNYEDDLREA